MDELSVELQKNVREDYQPGYNQFHEDVRVMLDPDQAEVAAICSL